MNMTSIFFILLSINLMALSIVIWRAFYKKLINDFFKICITFGTLFSFTTNLIIANYSLNNSFILWLLFSYTIFPTMTYCVLSFIKEYKDETLEWSYDARFYTGTPIIFIAYIYFTIQLLKGTF